MNDDTALVWREKSRKLLSRCRIFDLYQVEKRSPEGETGEFYLLDSPDWVTVIPVVRSRNGVDNFLMVEQYRHGSSEITLEFPAGMIDSGETPSAAAERELLEETGYSTVDLIEIGAVSPNPAFMNNTSYTFLARKLKLIKEQNLDKDEFIRFRLVPVPEVQINMGTGQYSNGVMMMALAYYNRFMRQFQN